MDKETPDQPKTLKESVQSARDNSDKETGNSPSKGMGVDDEPKESRKDRRGREHEEKRNGSKFKAIENKFVDEVLLLDNKPEDRIAKLEDTDYKAIYDYYQLLWVQTIDSMLKAKKFKYTEPDKNYFMRNYNPNNGIKIQKASEIETE